MNYSVGQIIYVILNKETVIYPMQVIEEITKKTLKGLDVNYVVRSGSSFASKEILLSEIDGEIFDTPESARVTLIKRATDAIEKLVLTAISKANDWYLTEENLTSLTQQSVDSSHAPVVENKIPEISNHDFVDSNHDQLAVIENNEIPTLKLNDGSFVKVRDISIPDVF